MSLWQQHWIKGIKLHGTEETRICKSCEYAKMTQKLIKSICERPRAKKFGELVHSDLWGLVPVKTRTKKVYYVSFTDDYMRWT